MGIYTTTILFQSQHGVFTLGRWNLGMGFSQASGVGGQK